MIALVLGAGSVSAYKVLHGGSFMPEHCGTSLTRETVVTSTDLAAGYLMAQQRPDGNFVYEYDWVARKAPPGDQQVRQAGAAWGVALIARHIPSPERTVAAQKAITFFARSSRDTKNGATLVAYSTDKQLELGTTALIALAHIDALAPEVALPPDVATAYRTRLTRLVEGLRTTSDGAGLFHPIGNPVNESWSGEPSPYADGEALLALIRAAKLLGRDDLHDELIRDATACYKRHVTEARKLDHDSDDTKGFYQWGTMAFYELATSGWPGTEQFASYAFELADWVIDQHRILDRPKNTGYAVEGLLHAYELARLRNDARAKRYACVSRQLLETLISWQVGGPTPDGYIRSQPAPEPSAVGGIQNESSEPSLRIDVTQHQTHAMLLATRWLFTP